MSKDFMKVKRGMVFMYDINPNISKTNVPKLKLQTGREITDCKMYGMRGYLVVSNDVNNMYSNTCNILPISSSSRDDLPMRVKFNYQGKDLEIMCEHIYTVNTEELLRYAYTLSDEIMSQVDKALSSQLGIVSEQERQINLSLDRLESIIQGIITQKASEILTPKKADEVDIQDAIDRISEGLLSKVGVPSDVIAPKSTSSQIDKFYQRYPQMRQNQDEVVRPSVKVESTPNDTEGKAGKPNSSTSSPAPRRKWTIESMQEFMDDVSRLSPQEMVKNYGFKNMQDYFSTKYYVQNRLAKVRVNEQDD